MNPLVLLIGLGVSLGTATAPKGCRGQYYRRVHLCGTYPPSKGCQSAERERDTLYVPNSAASYPSSASWPWSAGNSMEGSKS